MAVELYRANFQVVESSSICHQSKGRVGHRISRHVGLHGITFKNLKVRKSNINQLVMCLPNMYLILESSCLACTLISQPLSKRVLLISKL